MKIKLPPCYDISHYETVPNFSVISPKPLLMITKATEGAYYVDPVFVEYFAGMKSASIARGAYHFFRKASSITAQADNFITTVQYQITVNDFLILDVEEGGESAAQLKAWLDQVRAKFPHNPLMIYSRAELLNQISMTQAERDYFKQIPTWTAGYPFVPDLYSSIPASYIPDQTRWGECVLWQYSDKGAVGGITGKVDLNYMTPKLIAMVDGFTTPPPVNTDKVVQTHEGITLHELTRFGTKVYIHIIDTKEARIQISNCGYRTPLYAMGMYDADVVSNGGGWPNQQDALHRSNEMWVNNGEVMQPIATIKDNRPYINVSSSGVVTVSKDAKPLPDLYNAVGFDRILLWGGVFNTAISDRTTKDARTGSGKSRDGKFVLLSAEGNDYHNRGLTFPEMADIFKEFDVIDAGNNDGGSSTCVRNNAASDDPLFTGSDGTEAPVINHIMVFSGGVVPPVVPPIGETMPTVKAVQKLNTTPTNIKPMDGSPSYAIAQLQAGWYVYGDRSATGSDIIEITAYYKGSDVAKVLLSEKCKASVSNLTVTPYTPPTDPPPVEPPPVVTGGVNIDITVTDDSGKVIAVNSVKVNGANYVNV